MMEEFLDSMLEALEGGKNTYTSVAYRTEKGRVKLKVPVIIRDCSDFFGSLPPATKVEITITPKDPTKKKITITLPSHSASELLGGEPPRAETFDLVYRRLRERKNDPLPEPEIPGGGGKSHSAQGQTKKPGSHSQDRHK